MNLRLLLARKRSEDSGGEKKEYRREITAPVLVIAVLLLLILSSYIDTRLTRENENLAVILLQMLIFLPPSVGYLYLTGRSLSGLRIRPFGIGHLFLMLSALIAVSSSSMLLDFSCAGYPSLSDSYGLYGIFVSKSDGSVGDGLYLILAYAVLPAFCEEFLFRAVLCAEYEKRSTVAAILLPSLFFAMLHLDPAHFPALFVSGVILSLTLYSTRSVFAPFAVHLCCNLISLFGRPLLRTLFDLGGERLFTVILTALWLLSGFIFCAEAARLYRGYSDRNLDSSYRDMRPAYEKPSGKTAFSVAGMFSYKHPRLTATLTAVFSPTALAVYVIYAAAVLF